MNKHSYVTRITALGSVVNIALSIILGIYFGFRGIAWATAVDLGVVYLILFPRTVCMHTGIPGASYFTALCRGVLPVAAAMYFYYFFSQGWLEPSYPRIVMLCVIQSVLFCIIFWVFVLTGNERKWVRELMMKRGLPRAG
tara:strand:- start:6 stop:425 length:420 start_codon:yes stop_codon:yes gene_type:complete